MHQYTDPNLNTAQWEQQMFQIKNPPPKRRTWQDYAIHIWETGEWDCFEEFLHYYEPIINKAVTQYMNRYGLQGHFGDLKMTYVEALCAAMKTYPGGDLPFLKYAGRKITAALHGYAMTNLKGFSDTAPTHFYQLRKAAHICKSGSEAPVEEICTSLHITEKTAIRLIEEVHALDTFCWLDAPLEDEEEVQIPDDSDAMRLSHPIRPEAALIQKEQREWLHNAFWRLNHQEQDVISRHLGFYKRCFCPTRPQTFEELADVYQLASAGSVMRRYRKALDKLRGFLEETEMAGTQIGTCNSDEPELTSHKSFWKGDVMNSIIELLKRHLEEHPQNFGDGDSVLTMLYECYNENNPFDSERILADFHALYEAMNGKTLREMDEIVYPVCTLCRDHERAGFVEGVKVGLLLAQEIGE